MGIGVWDGRPRLLDWLEVVNDDGLQGCIVPCAVDSSAGNQHPSQVSPSSSSASMMGHHHSQLHDTGCEGGSSGAASPWSGTVSPNHTVTSSASMLPNLHSYEGRLDSCQFGFAVAYPVCLN